MQCTLSKSRQGAEPSRNYLEEALMCLNILRYKAINLRCKWTLTFVLYWVTFTISTKWSCVTFLKFCALFFPRAFSAEDPFGSSLIIHSWNKNLNFWCMKRIFTKFVQTFKSKSFFYVYKKKKHSISVLILILSKTISRQQNT